MINKFWTTNMVKSETSTDHMSRMKADIEIILVKRATFKIVCEIWIDENTKKEILAEIPDLPVH